MICYIRCSIGNDMNKFYLVLYVSCLILQNNYKFINGRRGNHDITSLNKKLVAQTIVDQFEGLLDEGYEIEASI